MVTVAIGVDIAEERKGLDLVALDGQRAIIERIARSSVADVVATITRIAPDVVCIDSPPAWALSGKSRTAERALRTLGITAFSTPTDPGDHKFYRWMRIGFAAFEAIAGSYPYYRSGQIQKKALEVFPEATATLLTGTLCPKGQKIPFRRAALRLHDIDDTLLPTIDAVDAGLAALTGLLALEGQFTAIGDPAEGVIILPVTPLPAAPLQRPLMGAAPNLVQDQPITGVSPTLGLGEKKYRSLVVTPDMSPPNSRLCGCGCGAAVSRRFRPGHDAKLKSRLLRAARQGDVAAEQQLLQLGWLAADLIDPPSLPHRTGRAET